MHQTCYFISLLYLQVLYNSILLYIRDLFNDAVSSSHHMASSEGKNNELVWM
jgi:hypothetical protein